MWVLDNQTPFAADRCWDRDRDGAEVWIVAVKGTFAIRSDGTLRVAKEQVPVCLVQEFSGEPGQSSLRAESDIVRTKPTTDVLLNGTAHAPGGKPARSVDVTLRANGREKTLRVFGDRTWVALGPRVGDFRAGTVRRDAAQLRACLWGRGQGRGNSGPGVGHPQPGRDRIRGGRGLGGGPAVAQRRIPPIIDLLVEAAAAARRLRTNRRALGTPFGVRWDLR